MDNTLIKGMTTELDCIRSFIAMGYQVSIPYGDCARYDFLAEKDGKIIRVQVKSSNWVDEDRTSFMFYARSAHINSKGVKQQKYDETQIDYFATFFEGKCYVIPVQECSVSKTLRFIPTKSGQCKGVNFATDYELEKVLK